VLVHYIVDTCSLSLNDVEGMTNTDTSIQVYSPQGIIAERSMYLNDKGAGTDTIGCYSD